MIEILETFRHGKLLYFPQDMVMGECLKLYNEYSEQEVQLLCSLLRPRDIAIDAGACIGTMTIPMAQTGAGIIAVEPQRTLYHMLCGSVALNGLSDRVKAMHGALGDVNASIRVPRQDYDGVANFGGLAIGQDAHEGEEVPLWTVDSLDLPALRLLKADVEGMEPAILLGAKETIAKYRPFLYFEVQYDWKPDRLFGILRDLGYRIYDHRPPYMPEGSFLCGYYMISTNVLCVPDEAQIDVAGLKRL